MARYDDYDDDYDDDLDISRSRGQSEYAGFWLRFAAMFLDGLILLVPNLILQVGLAFSLGFMRASEQFAFIGIRILLVLLYWLYFTLQESGPSQATFGKRAVGILVTDLDGRRLTFGKATGRHFAKILSLIPCWAGFIMAAFTERKQGLHDMMAGTLVVRR